MLADKRLSELTAEYSLCVNQLACGRWPDVSDATDPLNRAIMIGADGSQWDWPAEGVPFSAEGIPADHLGLVGSQIEIDIAVADIKCRQQTDYVARYAQIVFDAQARYLEDHKAEFDAMLAQIAQASQNL